VIQVHFLPALGAGWNLVWADTFTGLFSREAWQKRCVDQWKRVGMRGVERFFCGEGLS
jgi:hypothetical protein